MKKNVVFIYKLVNPINSTVFYVGATGNTKQRLNQHCAPCNALPTTKILLKDDIKPQMKVIEKCIPGLASEREKYWVNKMRQRGFALENKSSGGYGPDQGRKPVNDPKIGVRAYIHKSAIAKLGGLSATVEVFHEAVEKKLKVKK